VDGKEAVTFLITVKEAIETEQAGARLLGRLRGRHRHLYLLFQEQWTDSNPRHSFFIALHCWPARRLARAQVAPLQASLISGGAPFSIQSPDAPSGQLIPSATRPTTSNITWN